MPDSSFVRADFRAILLLLRQQIATVTEMHLSFIVVALGSPDDVPHHRGDKDVLLIPGDETPDADVIEGGGRVVNLRYRKLEVVPRMRRHLDRAEADLIRLTDESLGFLAFEDSVLDACEIFMAEDASQNVVALPAPCGRVGRPRKDRQDGNWVSSTIDVTLGYLRDLDQSRQ
jgi:hypothetical protein